MLQSADGDPVRQVGDQFLVHMDREALGDRPVGKYDVSVIITQFERDVHIEWTISGTMQPPIKHLYGYWLEPSTTGTLVTSYYDWSQIEERYRDKGIFPIIRRPHCARRSEFSPGPCSSALRPDWSDRMRRRSTPSGPSIARPQSPDTSPPRAGFG
jgi:hypothetical protein